MSNEPLSALSPDYDEFIGELVSDDKVIFTDKMNQFISDLVSRVDNNSGSLVTFDGGSLAQPINSFLDGGGI